MIKVKASNTSVLSSLRAIQGGLLETAVRAVRQDLHQIQQRLMPTVPTDTNRLFNGWAEAFNRTRSGPVAMRPLKKSRFTKARLRSLLRQWTYFDELVRRREEELSRGVRNRRTMRRLNRLIKLRDRALEELQRYRDSDGRALTMINKGRNIEVTVRQKVYGGSGFYSVRNGGRGVSATLINREPHALISNRYGRRAGYLDRAVASVGQQFRAPRKQMFAVLNANSRRARRAARTFIGSPV